MTCSHFYRTLLPRDVVPTCRRKWAEEYFAFPASRWKEICRLPYEVSASTKLQALQYRIINRYIPTRKFLHDRRIVESPRCLYCSQTDNINHFLYHCCETLNFWNIVIQEINRKMGSRLHISPETVIFGQKKDGVLANFLLLIGKQYVMNRKLNGQPISASGFWSSVNKYYEIEKCCATQLGGNAQRFKRKWRKLYNI